MSSHYLSVTEAARLLGISRQAVLSLIARKKLPAERVGTAWILDRRAVEARKAERGRTVSRPSPTSGD